MKSGHETRFHRIPVRVAAITTAVVAALYLIVAIAVAFIVSQNLVATIDSRLAQQLTAIEGRPDVLPVLTGGRVSDLDNDGDARRFDAPLLVWVREPGGTVYQSDATAVLPADLQSATGPTTATIGGAEMRLAGGPLNSFQGTGWVTIAQTMAEATNARNTLILAEFLIAPPRCCPHHGPKGCRICSCVWPAPATSLIAVCSRRILLLGILQIRASIT